MSDSLDRPTAPSSLDFVSLHHRVVTDTDLDKRYGQPLSNAKKVEAICGATGLKPEDLDLTLNYPLPIWADCDDGGLILTGLFLTDLQEQFYGLVIDANPKAADHRLWEAHATAEYWSGVFDRVLARRSGMITRDMRPLH